MLQQREKLFQVSVKIIQNDSRPMLFELILIEKISIFAIDCINGLN
ncbi:hypothetical protein NC99_10080 [Sunxiuqinia dokdonensis]|uniref:Uncharacterized protein n=1 Tax=Sunxiuqinia dokdonensis TaxID=1409788 RepID=A0A0L8VCL3_9BACT|nr:hypothetical protein NC99_10080 [Sunxiuqinia dokdonensis]